MKEESKIKIIKLKEPAFLIAACIMLLFGISLIVVHNYEYLSSLTWKIFSRDVVSLGINFMALLIFLVTMGFAFGEIKVKRSTHWYLIRFVLEPQKDSDKVENNLA